MTDLQKFWIVGNVIRDAEESKIAEGSSAFSGFRDDKGKRPIGEYGLDDEEYKDWSTMVLAEGAAEANNRPPEQPPEQKPEQGVLI